MDKRPGTNTDDARRFHRQRARIKAISKKALDAVAALDHPSWITPERDTLLFVSDVCSVDSAAHRDVLAGRRKGKQMLARIHEMIRFRRERLIGDFEGFATLRM